MNILLCRYRIFYYLCNENPRPGLRIDANHILTLTRINHTAGEEPTSWQMRIYCADVYDWRCKDTKIFGYEGHRTAEI